MSASMDTAKRGSRMRRISTGKRIELLKDALPAAIRIGMMFNPDKSIDRRDYLIVTYLHYYMIIIILFYSM